MLLFAFTRCIAIVEIGTVVDGPFFWHDDTRVVDEQKLMYFGISAFKHHNHSFI